MNTGALAVAIQEAERFLDRAKALRSAHQARLDPVRKLAAPAPQGLYDHPIEQGAVRRASMDLTRSLARLRSAK